MWDWANRYWWCCFVPEPLQKHPNQTFLLTTRRPPNDAVDYSCIFAVARMFASWFNRRRRRFLLLILCSPLIIPLIFAACPFICAAEICFCVCRKRRMRADADGGDRRGCTGDGGVVAAWLMQRYLEDQLMLVVGSVYGCGDDDRSVEEEGDGVDVKYLNSARPLLQ